MTPVTGDINRCPAAGKQQYHVLNPMPDGLLREMSTDWSDITESFYTVDAGQFQFEFSIISSSASSSTRATTETVCAPRVHRAGNQPSRSVC